MEHPARPYPQPGQGEGDEVAAVDYDRTFGGEYVVEPVHHRGRVQPSVIGPVIAFPARVRRRRPPPARRPRTAPEPYLGEQGAGERRRVAPHRQVDPHAGIPRRRQVAVDHRGLRQQCATLGGPRGQARTEHHHHIGIGRRGVRLPGTHAPDEAEVVRVRAEQALGGEGGDERGAGGFGERGQRLTGAGADGPPAGEQQRSPGVAE